MQNTSYAYASTLDDCTETKMHIKDGKRKYEINSSSCTLESLPSLHCDFNDSDVHWSQEQECNSIVYLIC